MPSEPTLKELIAEMITKQFALCNARGKDEAVCARIFRQAQDRVVAAIDALERPAKAFPKANKLFHEVSAENRKLKARAEKAEAALNLGRQRNGVGQSWTFLAEKEKEEEA